MLWIGQAQVQVTVPLIPPYNLQCFQALLQVPTAAVQFIRLTAAARLDAEVGSGVSSLEDKYMGL